jgi:branched-subunit amino acid ABC-type transport system permease component
VEDLIRTLLIGLGVGAIYVLCAQGLITIFRGSGVLNLGLGAIGMVGAYVAWTLNVNNKVPVWAVLIIGVTTSALIGVVVQLLVARIFSGAKTMVEALTFFATAMVSVLVAVYLCDLLIAGPDVLLLRAGERAAIVGFVKDTCLMVFAYFFGTRSNGASNDAN